MRANHPNVAWPAHGNELDLLAALLAITGVQSEYMHSLRPAGSSSLGRTIAVVLAFAVSLAGIASNMFAQNVKQLCRHTGIKT